MISKATIVYNAKPKSCPTADSVFVDVDLSVNLRIGPDIERAQTFVFEMGAERLDAYLHFQVEESIRQLVYSVTHDRVNDLRSEFANEMLETLKGKVTAYGVEVVSVKITDVQLPRELQERLEKTTAFKTRIEEDEKLHEHNVMKLDNQHEQKKAEIRQKYAIEKQRLDAATDQYEVTMDEKMAIAASKRAVEEQNAHSAVEVAVTQRRGEIEVAAFKGRANKEDLISSTRMKCEAQASAEQHNAEACIKVRDLHTCMQ
jgi:regulator of protease activity HflC (stomatin/prohibitin superfamily)